MSNAAIRDAANAALGQVTHPSKVALFAGFGPVIDGTHITDELFNLVRNGNIRPSTPISWNFAENDAWSFTDSAFSSMQKVPALAAQSDLIASVQASSGFAIPSDFFDQWLPQNYGTTHQAELLNLFGCPTVNGVVQDCQEAMDRYVTAASWACAGRWAVNGALSVSRKL